MDHRMEVCEMKISTAFLSEIGGRERNEDTVCIRQKERNLCVFVGDGLGGYDGGKIASVAAAEAVMKHWESQGLMAETHMRAAAAAADEAVQGKQASMMGDMKTTLVALQVEGEQARWMHVGDSRLYYFRNGTLVTQTLDHSVSQMAVLMGEIPQEGIRFHADRSRVLRALGSGNAKPDISPLTELKEDTAILMCTDGFWEYVNEKEMETTLNEAKEPVDWLGKMKEILEKRVPQGNDNFSAAAVFCKAEHVCR